MDKYLKCIWLGIISRKASKMKRLLWIIVGCMFIGIGQLKAGWTKTFGGTGTDVGNSVQRTSDGGFIIAGSTNSFGAGNYDIYLIKTNSSGDTLWTKTFGGDSADSGNSVRQTSDGGFIIAGNTNSFGVGKYDIYLIKTNSLGDTLWTKTFGGTGEEYGWSVQQTSDGGFIIAGKTNSFGAGSFDVYLIKTNSSGDTLWTRIFGGTGADCGRSVQQTSDGGFIIAGYTYSFGAGSYDVYLIKTNSLGDTLWTKTFGGTKGDMAYSVQQTFDGGFIITGYTESFGVGSEDVYLIKTNSSGDTLWTKTFGGTGSDMAYSVQQAFDGGFIIAGKTNSFWSSGENVYLIKTNSSGNTLWTKIFSGTGEAYGRSVQQTSDGGFIIAGYTESFGAGNYDVYLIKTDSLGFVGTEKNESSEFRVIGSKVCFSTPAAIKVDVKIYDICGRLRNILYQGILKEGDYTFTPVIKCKGIYFVVIQTNSYKQTFEIIKL